MADRKLLSINFEEQHGLAASQYALLFDSSIEGDNREAVLSNAEDGCRLLSERAATITELEAT